MTSLATIYSIQKLQETLGTIFGDSAPVPFVAFDRKGDIASTMSHLILLGGYLSIPGLRNFPARACLPCGQDFEEKDRRKVVIGSASNPSKEFTSQYDPAASPPLVKSDYALLTIISEANSKRNLIWLSGNYGLATYGAVLFLTQPQLFSEELHVPAPGQFLQVVLQVEMIEKNELDPGHRGFRVVTVQSGSLQPDFSLSMIDRRPAGGTAA